MEAVECGAACLAMILGHYGRWVPLEELRIKCGVGRDGSKASNLCKAARFYDMNAKGFKKEPEGLKDIQLPAIIHWNFNHYVVLEGISQSHAWLNDPASGPRRISRAALDESFTGVLLAFAPNSEFQKSGRRTSTWGMIWQYMGNSRSALGLVAILTLALVIPGIVIPAFARIFVDDILIAQREDWLVPLALSMAATVLLLGVNTWLQQFLLLRMELKLSLSMASRLLDHILKLPIAFFNQRAPGELANRLAAPGRVAALISGQLASAFLGAITAVFLAGVMLIYDPVMGSAIVLITMVNFMVLKAVSQRQEIGVQNLMQSQGAMFARTVGAIRSIESIKAGALESEMFSTWSGYQAKALNAGQTVGRTSAMIAVMPTFLSALTAVVALCFGALRVIQGQMTLGDLVAFQLLVAAFTLPISNLVGFGSKVQMIRSDLARIEDVFRYQPNPTLPGYGTQQSGFGQLRGEVAVRHVSFGYNPLDPPFIRDFSCVLKPGRRIALVGGSGSGKSTIGRIVAGLMDPDEGEILYDGIPIGLIDRTILSGSVAYVDQDIFLFEGTIRDNLTLWDDSISDAVIWAALRDAQFAEEIEKRPNGLQAHVTEGGMNFSGGQRQRLEIARALVGEPSVLILDEATAALDPVTEALIDDALRRRGVTCVIVAHRLSTIRDCDEIIVLKRGREVERGTHDVLVAAKGEYAALLETQ
ncbi:NHLM bacteriocin system ABC transporter, peptidase/ATP-binding protein [Puniceibacterium sediminis]|uniref:NHLM bacteriocin system ABC transporter, peptidase/ATP-binding protein n=2 Tax=Puniceibacterium sediminis TaxID=1608407 RepID=A0A238ZI86_9RHOB|nr:NHLM bacteriocin system ABC transporter, peptidase/ATP-binding protein [Puniceibacterium sediminis]